MRIVYGLSRIAVAVAATLTFGCSESARTGPDKDGRAEAVSEVAPSAAASEAEADEGSSPVDAAESEAGDESEASDVAARAAFERLTRRGISVEEWESAHAELVQLGPAAASVLRGGLKSSDPLAREWSASILALNAEAATAARTELVAALQDPSGYVQANVAAALTLVPGEEPQVAPVLLKLLASDDEGLRSMALVNLPNVASALAPHVEELLPLLSTSDPEVVRAVIEMLGRLGPEAAAARPRLEELAAEKSQSSLSAAAQTALEQIRDGATEPDSPTDTRTGPSLGR